MFAVHNGEGEVVEDGSNDSDASNDVQLPVEDGSVGKSYDTTETALFTLVVFFPMKPR